MEYAAYLASKMALWSLIHKSYSNITDWSINAGASAYPAPLRTATMDAMKSIRDKALNHTAQPAKEVTLSIANPKTDGSYYTAIATVGGDILPGRNNYLEMVNEDIFPSAIKVTSMDGIEFEKEPNGRRYLIPDGTTEFKIIVPDTKTMQKFKFAFFAATGNKTLLYGKAPNASVQNYVLAGIGYQGQQAEFDIGNPPTTTETGLTIYKYATNTTEGGARIPLEGVTFELINSAGQSLGVKASDANGRVNWSSLPLGTYHIYERSNNGLPYQLTPPTYQHITLTEAQPDGMVTFFNDPTTTITPYKEDAVTGEKIKGVQFELRQIDGNGSFVAVAETDAQGRAIFANLPDGTYSVREVSTVEPYILDSTPQIAVIKNGQAPSLKFLNSKHPTLTIQKRDAETGEVINAPATFHVEQKDGTLSFDVTTGQSYKLTGTSAGITGGASAGAANITNLPAGTYVISEKISPAGWALDSTPQTVHLGANQSVQVVMKNTKTPTITIEKLGAPPIGDTTGNAEGVPGTIFTVKKLDGTMVGSFTTGADGTVTAGLSTTPGGYLEPGTYEVTEVSVPAPFLLPTDGSQTQTVVLKAGDTSKLVFMNKRKPALRLQKVDARTGELLRNAEFRLQLVEGSTVSKYILETGEILIEGLEEKIYRATEFMAPDGYVLLTESKEILLDSSKVQTLKFDNVRKPVVMFLKTNGLTGAGIPGATYKVEYEMPNSGGIRNLGSFKTDANGRIIIPKAEVGWYVFTETHPAPGFSLPSNPVTRMYFAAGDNAYLPEMDKYYTAGTGVYASGTDGATTTTSPTATPNPSPTPSTAPMPTPSTSPGTGQSGADYYVQGEGFNFPLNSIVIKKTNSVTSELLAGATFGLYRADEQVSGVPGTLIGRYTTDHSGIVVVTGLQPGFYVVKEEQAPPFFLLSENNQQNGFLKADGTSVLEFSFANIPYGSILITKTDGTTNKPLAGVVFKVTDAKGAVVGNSNGEYTTDSDGKILIPNVKPADYVITELRSLPNYTVDSTPKVLSVGTDGKTYSVSFVNHENGSLIIKKTDSVTKAPIEGVEFSVSRLNGEKVGSYKTDKNGLISIPNLAEATYSVVEKKSKDGYLLDSEPRLVEIKKGTAITLEVENTPMSGLLIVKRDEMTGKPLQGVVYDVRRADGQFVAGSILDGNQPNTIANSPNKTTSPNGDITGSYTTDANGRILINALPAGEYHVIERKALDNYEIDPEVHSVTITPGKLSTLQLTNRQKAGLRILKVDSITNKPISNVEFMVFDMNGKVVGNFYSDNNGVVDLSAVLPAGRFTIRETREAEGYYPDHTPRTVEFVAGKMTEIVWKNTPQRAQIQITKLSADDNEINGLPAGTPLANAVFEVYDYRTGNMVDRFVTQANGKGISQPLPLGRYLVKEVQAPAYYRLNAKELDVTLEFATQIVKLEYQNYSANTGVFIKKTGNLEALPGQQMRYDIKAVQNQSTVPLSDFYWRDVLPVDAVRLDKIVTGSYNQSLRYKIIAQTNKGNARIIADNLSTTMNHVIDCAPSSLGLASDEFIVSFGLYFGTVRAGFTCVEQPQVYVTVNKNLPNGYPFSNKVDVGGKYGGEWIIGNSTWRTVVYRSTADKLPKTGY